MSRSRLSWNSVCPDFLSVQCSVHVEKLICNAYHRKMASRTRDSQAGSPTLSRHRGRFEHCVKFSSGTDSDLHYGTLHLGQFEICSKANYTELVLANILPALGCVQQRCFHLGPFMADVRLRTFSYTEKTIPPDRTSRPSRMLLPLQNAFTPPSWRMPRTATRIVSP
jgi:hypothetical protein